MSVLIWSICRAFNNWLLSKNWFSWKIGLIQITDAIFASKEQCYFTRFFIYDLLPCNHTKIYIIILDINLLKYRTPCSAAERQRALGKNSKLPVYESYNKLFHRILSTCLKLHIPANLQTRPSQPKHSLITLNILPSEYFKSGRQNWVTFSTISIIPNLHTL